LFANTDFIMNGNAHGEVAERLGSIDFDPGLLRPYFDEHGERCVTLNTGRVKRDDQGRMSPIFHKFYVSDLMHRGVSTPVLNATMLRKDDWLEMDRVVLRAARQRLRAWSDLSARNSFGGFNGMAKMILEHETMSDPGQAVVDMDALTESTTDAPKFQLEGLPLPITHSDFHFSERRLRVSRNSGTPLDLTQAEAAGRRVGELIEKTLIGTQTGVTYGGNSTLVGGYSNASKVWGYTNFTDRLTYTSLTTPTGTNPNSTVNDVLAMRELLYDDFFYGPFMIYHSTDWDQYLDNDYYVTSTGAPYQTLRDRLRTIEGIEDVRRLDFLTASTNPYTMIMVQMTPDVARAVNGMNITTVQWESMGGLRQNFKVMAIQVPQLRSEFSGKCGLLHATTS